MQIGQNITKLRADSIAYVNKKIGETRILLITDIPGQEMIYTEKEREAAAFLLSGDTVVNPVVYPLMHAELGITAGTGNELAQVWLNMAGLWKVAASQMEQLRLGSIGAVKTATNKAQIQNAVTAFDVSLESWINAQGV